jgi:hypothetical protein
MDSYQAVYDAVRSKISNGNVGDAVAAAVRDANLSFYADMARNCVAEMASEYQRPSAIYRPSLAPDGTKWCALYGENLAVGVAGFGDTPEDAMRDFDRAWFKERTPHANLLAKAVDE